MKKQLILSVCFILLLVLAWRAPDSVAYDMYQPYPGGGCSQCHPSFIGGETTPLHDAHTVFTTECKACHMISSYLYVKTWYSGSGYGCTGCHDGGGLKLHHTNAGAPADTNGQTCNMCHYIGTPYPESTAPPYYGFTPITTIVNPCQSTPAPPGEDFDSDGFGLDNDGDLLYDENDPDCYGAICGDGIVWLLEECDDGNLIPGDGCDEFCKAEDCLGDFDSDGDVDGNDLEIFSIHFGRTNCPMPTTSSLKDEVTLLKEEIERLEAEIVDKQKEIDALKVK